MKKFYFLLTVIMAVMIIPAFSTKITILSVGDTHSNIAPGAPRKPDLSGTTGGIARASSVIMSEKMSGSNVLLLHAGDVFLGDLVFNATFGVAELQMMLQLGFDAMTLGNHEFDLTPDVLQMVVQNAFQESSFPLLSANMICEAEEYDALKSYVKDYTVKEIDGIKIGIIGLTTPETNFISLPAPIVISDDIAEKMMTVLGALKAEGCDFVILLSHFSFVYDIHIAQNFPGIDLIIGGHDHYALEAPFYVDNPEGKPVPIIQCGAYYNYIGKTVVEIDKENFSLDYTLIRLDENIPELPQMKAAVEGVTELVEQKFGFPYLMQVTTATDDFYEKAPEPTEYGFKDTPVGNLVTEALLKFKNTDIAVTAGGLTQGPLHKGPITTADLFRMIGYGFNTANGLGYRTGTFEVSGLGLATALEFGMEYMQLHDEYLIQCSGMSYVYDYKLDSSPKVFQIIIGDKPLEYEKMYSCTANEFTISFLGFLGIPIENVEMFDETEFMLVSAMVSGKEEISPLVDGRVQNSKFTNVKPNIKSDSKVSLYPNPAKESLNIAFDEEEIVKIIIFDLFGKEVLRRNVNGEAFNQNIILSEIPNGLYICNIVTKAGAYQERLIIAK